MNTLSKFEKEVLLEIIEEALINMKATSDYPGLRFKKSYMKAYTHLFSWAKTL
jgi:hypothetical protein